MSEEKLTATWRISLDCDCPKCAAWVDLLCYPDFWDMHKDNFQVGEHSTKNSRDLGVVCPECGHEFMVDLEY